MGIEVQEVQTIAAAAAQAEAKHIPEIFRKPLKQLTTDEEEEEPPPDDSEVSTSQGIPVVDMAALVNGDDDELDELDAAEEIARACREWGFVQVVNHGIPNELLQKMRELALEYFQMPAADRVIDWKELIKNNSGTRDWTDTLLHYPKPYKPDVAPRTKFPEGYREVLNQYTEEVLKLARRLQRVLSLKVGLSRTRFEEVMGDLELVVRVNYYPPCPCPELVTGLAAHSDAGILTVLLTNEVEGLQVLKNERWVTVQVLPNSLVINVADMLQVISNGAYVSCEHRAFVNSRSARLSVAVFVITAGNLTLGPLPELVNEQNPPSYKPVLFNQYVAEFTTRGLDRKTLLESYAISSPS